MQEAGATATLEMAFTIADGIEYCRSSLKLNFGILLSNLPWYLAM